MLHIIEYLKIHFMIPSVFSYLSTRMLLAAFTALILTICLGPFFIRKLYSMKIGQPIRSGEICPVLADLHEKKKDTPTMGGVLILFSLMISTILWVDFRHIFTWLLVAIMVIYGGLGIRDDYLKLKYKNSYGLKARYKFLIQVIFAVFIASYLLFPGMNCWIHNHTSIKSVVAKEYVGKNRQSTNYKELSSEEYGTRIFVPFFKKSFSVAQGWKKAISFLLIVFVIVGTSNAVNLTDGLDGLASGLIVLVAGVLSVFAFLSNHIGIASYLNILYIEGSGEIGVFLFALIGACLGFLWYNGYPAQVFMGDTGSLAMGGILGMSAVLLRREILLSIVGGIFVAETLSVILQVLSYRYRNKKRIFLCSPLHHHFEYKGWSETKVVLRFWIIGLLLAIVGLASIKFQ
ncbi:MAG: phospho-N-acetylmuramoyl-pentapeptide-transferase [Parachlamydiales bacterium]|nr:phospho-N-acetylmuramoyl-pentapeptide-transferase [Parachlamydiales bacterium]